MNNPVTNAIRLAGISLLASWSLTTGAETAENHYSRLCAGCHTSDFTGTVTNSAETLTRTDRELAGIIQNGLADRGMPAFGNRLSDEEILSLVQLIRQRSDASGNRLGTTVEAESLNAERSANFLITGAESDSSVLYVGYFDEGSSLCYNNIDLTGVKSIDFNYARGMDDPGRFAILIGEVDAPGPTDNLGEKDTASTGGWEKFARRKVGLTRQVSGRHLLCFHGVAGGGIFNLDSFTLSGEPGENDGTTLSFTVTPPAVLSAAGYEFSLEKVAEAASELWGMAFLPDGSILATQKNGQLLLFKNGERLGRIAGTPEVWNRGQGGLMAVKVHPNYSRNGWIYLTFSDPGEGNLTMTRVVRGKLDGLEWVDQQNIYRAKTEFYTDAYAHFGSRIALHDGYLYFGVGDRLQPDRAQDLAYPFGKIHRLHDDGRVPRDNPFAKNKSAEASIWSYGHRNPQGMAVHPRTGAIWSAEHGPAGGDEVNLIQEAINYGWPLVSFGINYDGTLVSDSPYREGVEPPVHHWTPSIAVSQIEFYTGDGFPAWQNQLLVASLGQEQLRLVRIRDNRVMNDRLLFKDLGRIRDVTNGPDGYPYVVLNHLNGTIYRLVPAARK